MTQPPFSHYNTPAGIKTAFLAFSDAARVTEDSPMVKVKGPLLSTDATGKLGNDLQLSHWKGRNVLGRRRRPSQPRTEAQQAHRIYMGFLGSQWKNFTPQQRVTWEALATQRNITPYNAFIAYSMARLNNLPGKWQAPLTVHAWPSQTFPADEALLPADWNYVAITCDQAILTAKWRIPTLNQNWIVTIHHGKLYPAQFRRTTLVHAAVMNTAGWGQTSWPATEMGLQYYAFYRISVDGRPHTTLIRRSVICTPAGSPPDHTGPPQDPPPPPIPF